MRLGVTARTGERKARTTSILLALGVAASAPNWPAEAQEAAPVLPATFTNPPMFWMPDTGSGWIDFDPEGDHIVIPVMLNGQPAKALVDTGFDQLVLSKAYADVHHLPLTIWGKTVGFGGAAD